MEGLEVVDSTLRGEYKKVMKALEFVMELVSFFSKSKETPVNAIKI
ncbi:MAG: hypothetical protein AB1502_06905 [Thermodesulfobacteriota bacterium]